jgi:hypothetical protein
VIAALVAALLVGGAQASASGLGGIEPFHTPSGNINCGYVTFGRPFLRCDISSGLRPPPRRHCDVDWVGLDLSATGRGAPDCAGDTIIGPHSRALAYGTKWARGGFVCSSARTGLTCRNRSGHGFFLSRQRWRVF